MNATLTFGAALLLGLGASAHCLAMCGGITAALGVATAKDAAGRPRAVLVAAYQLGRVASYALAGLLLSGLLGGLIALLDTDAVRRTLRALSAATMLLAALVVFGRREIRGGGSQADSGPGWRHSGVACCRWQRSRARSDSE